MTRYDAGMQVYALHFEWALGVTPERPGPHNIQARTDAEAIEAAGRLAQGQVFVTRPVAYRLIDQSGRLVETVALPS